MVKPYYCEYCDRRFKDEKSARKKHLESLQHKKNRADYYLIYREPEEILQEESSKVPCKRMMTTGECLFGSSCRFSHYSPLDLQQCQQIIMLREKLKQEKMAASNSSKQDKELQKNDDIDMSPWKLPEHLANDPNMPPSMWPINPMLFGNCSFPEWGSR